MVLDFGGGGLFSPQLDVTETLIGNRESLIIKSIQYGTINFADTDTSEAVSINSVIKKNSMLIYLGSTGESGVTGEPGDVQIRLEFTTGTSITGTRQTSDGIASVHFGIIEFQEGIIKSNQVGSIAIANTIQAETITEVDVTQTIVAITGYDHNSFSLDPDGGVVKLTLTNATTITGSRSNGAGTLNVGYQVIEFN